MVDDLQRRLDAAFAGVRRKHIVIACRAERESVIATVGGDVGAASEHPFAVGCLAKLLVAALVGIAVREEEWQLDAPAAVALGQPSQYEPLRGVSLKHLLEHTHGLDDSLITSIPLSDAGFIDARRLLDVLRQRRFAPPGQFYSYSNAGAWLLAAALERRYAEPFNETLRRRLFAPLGLLDGRSSLSFGGGAICPATGGPLAMSAPQLLVFLAAQFRAVICRWPCADAAASTIRPLPGWNALERGIHLGWKHYGGGWFGHHSSWPGAWLLVRVRVPDGAAIVVASRDHPAALVAGRVLADVLPELGRLDMPRRLSPQAAARFDPAPYCGRYASAAEVFCIRPARAGLHLTSGGFATELSPAARDVFYCRARGPTGQFFFQFLRDERGAFGYLWDGRRLFPLQSPRP
jgi:CubicO group peptidase (beta-lactamase class C family)